VEKLGAMTPEQLEEIPGIEPDMVENIQTAVVGYYGQFEEEEPTLEAAETTVDKTALETESEAAAEPPVETPAEKAIENESDRIENTEVPAAALESGKGEAELS
jgi:N utilization substance protein A